MLLRLSVPRCGTCRSCSSAPAKASCTFCARRLERAREDLTDPVHSHLSISDICFRWGFNDAAHFSRAFHDTYGVSPRNFRRAATAEMADRMLQYANRGWPEAPSLLRWRKALIEEPVAITPSGLHQDPASAATIREEDRLCLRASPPPRHHPPPPP